MNSARIWRRGLLTAAGGLLICAAPVLGQQRSASPPAGVRPPDGRQLVAVLDFDALGASKIEASTITDQVREGLLSRAGYRIVDRAQMDKVMAEQALQQVGCTSQECAVQVGKILGVRKLVTGKVTKVGNLWVLTANLIDVESAETLKAVSVQSEGDFRAALTGGAAGLVAKLAESKDPVSAVPAPAAPTEPPRPGDPRQGFTLHGGIRHESGTFKFKSAGSAKPETQVATVSGSTLERPTSGEAKLAATGVLLGGGYHWLLAPAWTLGAFLELYGGTVSGDFADLYGSIGGTNVGAEARYWLAADRFVGGVLFGHGETLTPTDDAKQKHDLKPISASGGGFMLVGGWDVRPQVTLGAQLEVGSANFANADYGYSALRVTAAYRWPYPAAER
jgi:TolB-like protein